MNINKDSKCKELSSEIKFYTLKLQIQTQDYLLRAEEIEAGPTFGGKMDTAYILGMAKLDGRVKILLDIDKVLNTQEIQMLEKT